MPKIVIDIPDEQYQSILDTLFITSGERVYNIIKNGIVLPKGTVIPFLLHKGLGCPLNECSKAYDLAIGYLRSKAKLGG